MAVRIDKVDQNCPECGKSPVSITIYDDNSQHVRCSYCEAESWPPPPAPSRPTRDSSRKSWADREIARREFASDPLMQLMESIFQRLLRFIDWLNGKVGAGHKAKPKQKHTTEQMETFDELFYRDESQIPIGKIFLSRGVQPPLGNYGLEHITYRGVPMRLKRQSMAVAIEDLVLDDYEERSVIKPLGPSADTMR